MAVTTFRSIAVALLICLFAAPGWAQKGGDAGPLPDTQAPGASERERSRESGPAARGKKRTTPKTPLELLMKDGIPKHAEKRAILREDLYALLATAATPKEAKQIAGQIERVWRATNSSTVAVLMVRATRALKAKKSELALELLDVVVELAPDHAEAWNRRAFLHFKARNFESAVGDLRRALALDPNHYKALDGLASIFQQFGDNGKALAVYEQLRQVYPHWPGLDKAYDNLKSKVQGRGI